MRSYNQYKPVTITMKKKKCVIDNKPVICYVSSTNWFLDELKPIIAVYKLQQ